jgi:hypothetical protein
MTNRIRVLLDDMQKLVNPPADSVKLWSDLIPVQRLTFLMLLDIVEGYLQIEGEHNGDCGLCGNGRWEPPANWFGKECPGTHWKRRDGLTCQDCTHWGFDDEKEFAVCSLTNKFADYSSSCKELVEKER